MSTYEPKVYREQGGNTLVVRAKDGGVIKGQAAAAGTPAQAATIAAVGLTTVAWTTTDKAKVNSIITALKNVGILATS